MLQIFDCSFQAADVEGEINLSTCFDITDYEAQKDCGFQIHVSSTVAQIYGQINEKFI